MLCKTWTSKVKSLRSKNHKDVSFKNHTFRLWNVVYGKITKNNKFITIYWYDNITDHSSNRVTHTYIWLIKNDNIVFVKFIIYY